MFFARVLLYSVSPSTGSPSLQFVLRDLYIYKDFVWELLDRVIYKTLYGNPLDFSKIYDIFMNDEIKWTYLLFSVYLSVLCSRPLKSHGFAVTAQFLRLCQKLC